MHSNPFRTSWEQTGSWHQKSNSVQASAAVIRCLMTVNQHNNVNRLPGGEGSVPTANMSKRNIAFLSGFTINPHFWFSPQREMRAWGLRTGNNWFKTFIAPTAATFHLKPLDRKHGGAADRKLLRSEQLLPAVRGSRTTWMTAWSSAAWHYLFISCSCCAFNHFIMLKCVARNGELNLHAAFL